MIQIVFLDRTISYLSSPLSYLDVHNEFCSKTGLRKSDVYFVSNGRKLEDNDVLQNCTVYVLPKLLGGKGGFGSMLRAIGAQIEKTTNREACRDLSGRRLRDINEEKRLKTWIEQQVEREKEVEDRKRKKLENMCQKPKHDFKDEAYFKERSELPDKVEDAVLQGLKNAETGNVGQKRKKKDKPKGKKKPKLWVDADLEDLSCSSDDSSNDDSSNQGSSSTEQEHGRTKVQEGATTSSLKPEEVPSTSSA